MYAFTLLLDWQVYFFFAVSFFSLLRFLATSSPSNTFCSQFSKPSHAKKKKNLSSEKGSNPWKQRGKNKKAAKTKKKEEENRTKKGGQEFQRKGTHRAGVKGRNKNASYYKIQYGGGRRNEALFFPLFSLCLRQLPRDSEPGWLAGRGKGTGGERGKPHRRSPTRSQQLGGGSWNSGARGGSGEGGLEPLSSGSGSSRL